jgi:hypothetical protein
VKCAATKGDVGDRHVLGFNQVQGADRCSER